MKWSIFSSLALTALVVGVPTLAFAEVGHRVSFFEGRQAGEKAGKQIVPIGLANQDNHPDFALVGEKKIRIISGRNKAELGSIDIPTTSQGRAFVAPLFDTDGDGDIEWAVGLPLERVDDNLGVVRIYELAKRTNQISLVRTLSRRAAGTQPAEELGTKVKLLPLTYGDIDGDGRSDIAVSAPYTRKDGIEVGSLTFFSSYTGRELFSLFGRHTGDRFGFDFDTCKGLHWKSSEEGLSELVVGVPGPNDSSPGRVEVHLLGNAAYNSELLFTFHGGDSVLSGESVGEQVGCLGRVHAGGVAYDDGFLVSTNQETGEQILNLFHYYERGKGKIFTSKHFGQNPITVAKSSRRAYRDLNQDGQHDVVVGEPRFSHGSYSQAGRVRVFDGSDQSLNTVMYQRLGWQTNLHLGEALDYASDLNGDGANDLAAGAANYSVGANGQNRGRGYVFSPTPLVAPTAEEVSGIRTDFADFEIDIEVDNGIHWSGKAGRPGDTVQLLLGSLQHGRFVYSEQLDSHVLLELRDDGFDALNIGTTKVKADGTFSGFVPIKQNFSFVGVGAHFQAVIVEGLQTSRGLTATAGHRY